MTRLIDADALLEALNNRDKNYQAHGTNLSKMYYIDDIKDLITNAPTVQREGWVGVADAIPDSGKEIIGCSAKGSIWLETFDKDELLSFMKYWQYAPAAPTDTE